MNMDTMNEFERRALVCHLVRTMRDEQSWTGETQIQKSAMFLQELLDVPLGYDFVLCLHGPFSFELRSELTLMRIRLYLDVEPRAHYGPSFTLGQRGKRVKPIPPEYQSAIDFVAQQVSGNNVRSLERISTAFFLQNEYPSLNARQVAEEIHRLKPHISNKQALQAIKEVDELKQAATAVKS